MRNITSIVIHHSAGTKITTPRSIDIMHKKRGFAKIGYHKYLFKQNEKWHLHIGRKDVEIGAHAKGYNRNSLGICLAGNYEKEEVEAESLDLLVEQISHWCRIYEIPVSEIYGHCQVGTTKTACPGQNLFTLIGQIKERVQKNVFPETNI